VNEQPRRLEDATILAMVTPAAEKLGTGPSAIERNPGCGGIVFDAVAGAALPEGKVTPGRAAR
jgi:hypothetical protein